MKKIDVNDLQIIKDFDNDFKDSDAKVILVTPQFFTHLVWHGAKYRLYADTRKPFNYNGVRIVRTRDIKTNWELI